MDVKIVFVIVCLCALAITSTEAGIPKCCMTANKRIHPQLIKDILGWEMQESTGPCDIRALVVFVRGMKKPLCAHPKARRLLDQLKKKKKRFF